MSRSYDITILSITTFSGDGYDGQDALERLSEADQVFYSVSYGGQEEFYRWVAGPFEDQDSLEAIIEEEETFYQELAA